MSVSGPNGPKIYGALPTSSLRTIVSPAWLISNCGCLSPESSGFATKPRYGPTSRLFTNRCGFSKVSTSASAVIGLTPFSCRNNPVCPYLSRPSSSIFWSYSFSQRARRKVEALFAELKNYIGLRRLRLRPVRFVREQFYLAATVQNLKRLVRFLSCKPTPQMTTA